MVHDHTTSGGDTANSCNKLLTQRSLNCCLYVIAREIAIVEKMREKLANNS